MPAGDADSLRLAIQLLLHNPELARRFGLAARQKVVREFQVTLVNERTLLQYHRLLKHPVLTPQVSS